MFRFPFKTGTVKAVARSRAAVLYCAMQLRPLPARVSCGRDYTMQAGSRMVENDVS